MFGTTIQHVTDLGQRQVEIPVGVDYLVDTDATRAALDGCIAGIIAPIDRDKPNTAFLAGLGGS